MSPRKLGVLIDHLPADSAYVQAVHDGQPGFSNTDNLLADLWLLTLMAHTGEDCPFDDHPARAAINARINAQMMAAHLAELKAIHQQRKRAYGLA